MVVFLILLGIILLIIGIYKSKQNNKKGQTDKRIVNVTTENTTKNSSVININIDYKQLAENFKIKEEKLVQYSQKAKAYLDVGTDDMRASVHSNFITQGFQDLDANQVNLSYAKLLESLRQLYESGESHLENHIKEIVQEYEDFRFSMDVKYPREFLPPYNERKSILFPDGIKDKYTLDEIAGFYGTEIKSPNEEYSLYYTYGHYENDKWVKSKLVLIKECFVLARKRFVKPSVVQVSNNGSFAVFDYCIDEDKYGGEVYIYQNFKQFLKLKIAANVYSIFFSDSSNFLLFNTLESDSDDANKLFIVDLNNKKNVRTLEHPEIWYESAIINDNKETITLILEDAIEYTIDFEGKLINESLYESQVLEKGKFWSKIDLLEVKYGDDVYNQSIYFDILSDSLKNNGDEENRAVIFRKLGEYYYANEQNQEAVDAWENAISINPKIGIKRKLESLKKKMS